MIPIFYWLLLMLIVIFAIWRGGREHRLAAIGCFVASLATRFLISPLDNRYDGIEINVIVIDLSLFGLFLAIALTSRRFWPLWIAGFHFTTLWSHALHLLDLDIIPSAYAVVGQFWSYPILLVIAVAVWRHAAREEAQSDLSATA